MRGRAKKALRSVMAVGLAGAVLSEGMAPAVASFAWLTVAWFLVAIEMRKG